MDKIEKRSRTRRHVRVPILCWRLEANKPVGEAMEIISKDLSVSGLGFESNVIHPLGTEFLTEIHLPGRKNPILSKVKVARIETVLGRNKYLIGTMFADIKLEDVNYIGASLEKMNLYIMLDTALRAGASDLHLTVGRPPILRVQGRIHYLKANPIEDGEIKAMVYPLLSSAQIEFFEKNKELDFAFSPTVNSRFRVNLHLQKGFLEGALRSIPTNTKTFEDLGLPVFTMERFCKEKSGLILISGTTGSGKTTTVASMINFINKNMEQVIITIEDPIEYIHTSQKGIIKQRELGNDTCLYAEALKRALRQDPDIIVVGELLDSETIRAAIRAAEAGHLVITSIHAPDTMQAIERIVNFFPPEHSASICQQLSSCLLGIVHQVLVPAKTGQRVLATELLIATTAVKNMIREGKYFQIKLSIQTGREFGMYTLENKLQELYEKGVIEFITMQEFLRPAKR